jgi:hypothetical protein
MTVGHRGRLKALAIEDVETPATCASAKTRSKIDTSVLALIWRTITSPAPRELVVRARQAFDRHRLPASHASSVCRSPASVPPLGARRIDLSRLTDKYG